MTDNPWIRPSNPLVIAHRGHSIALPENTMSAYERAVELGTDMIECDVNITRDGVLVMLHDSKLDRTTDGRGQVHDFSMDEVERLDAGRWMGPEHAGARVPTTEALLRFAKDAGILMCFEVKGADDVEADRIAIDLVDLFVRHDALEWAFMSSYHHRAMRVARQRVPELMLAPERLPDDVPADPVEASSQAARLGAPVLQNHWRFATDELVGQLHADGIALWTWPTTELEGIELSLDIGADAVMGDDVPAMVDAVRRRTGSTA